MMITTTDEFSIRRCRTTLPPGPRATAAQRNADANTARVLQPSVRVTTVADEPDWKHAHALILEHLEWIAASLRTPDAHALQADLRKEMADLQSVYTLPRGRRYLAWLDEQPVGTVGFTVGRDGAAEMRRLYVRPAGRGHNLGEMLMRAALTKAAELGCRTAWLETMPGLMEAAIGIYRRLGFQEKSRDEVSVPDAIYMEIRLAPTTEPTADPELVR